jgi:hypothetical protein
MALSVPATYAFERVMVTPAEEDLHFAITAGDITVATGTFCE